MAVTDKSWNRWQYLACLQNSNNQYRLGFCYNGTVPTILRIGGLRVVIYPNDHRPAHVHVIGNECEAVFCLHCPDGPAELRENFGFASKEIGRIQTRLMDELSYLCNAWRKTHGTF